MNHLFVPLWESLDLKELGFDEECLGHYKTIKGGNMTSFFIEQPPIDESGGVFITKAPTYDQAFKWFRDKKILGEVKPIDNWDMWGFSITMEDSMSPFFIAHSSIYTEYTTYEEAQLECLKMMIKISKTK